MRGLSNYVFYIDSKLSYNDYHTIGLLTLRRETSMMRMKIRKTEFFFLVCAVGYLFLILSQQICVYEDAFWINNDTRNISYFFHKLDDPGLFQNDILAEEGEKLAPAGWKWLFSVARFIVDPFFFSLILSHVLYIFSVRISLYLYSFFSYPDVHKTLPKNFVNNKNIYMGIPLK